MICSEWLRLNRHCVVLQILSFHFSSCWRCRRTSTHRWLGRHGQCHLYSSYLMANITYIQVSCFAVAFGRISHHRRVTMLFWDQQLSSSYTPLVGNIFHFRFAFLFLWTIWCYITPSCVNSFISAGPRLSHDSSRSTPHPNTSSGQTVWDRAHASSVILG